MDYVICEMKGPFGYLREGDGKIIYIYSSTVDPSEAIDQVVNRFYTDTFEDEEGEEYQDWSEYDPAVLETELAGELEDEMDFKEIADRIDGDASATDKFIELVSKEILAKAIPLIYIDGENNTISQLSAEKLAAVVVHLRGNLKIFIREYDHGYDY